MESLPYMIFTIHIPMEWLAIEDSYENLLNQLMSSIENYSNMYGSYEGLIININGVEAALFINIMRRIIWFKRIRIDDDPRPEIIHYYPSLAPPSLEEEWHWGVNNENDNIDNVDNEIFMENCISSTTDQNIEYNYNDDDK
ncbi:hypothetical protein PV328_012321 [Microctonus aethiopoides]|uniref:Uncharacterized protein n=1 Tax=Microctonus aethiopoides TaxID=144406 RepID=A0AA39FGV7_9HYME|nr:hypothetical protein PV328_012321 [Microctonus aethiopoides]